MALASTALPAHNALMPCLVGCLALIFPRVAIVLVWLFSDYLGRAYDTVLWPVVGFLFMPLTTLAYALAMNENNRSVSGLYLVIVIVAVLIDLGIIGSNAGSKRARTYYVARYRRAD